LHHHWGNQVRQNAKGEANGENGSFPEKESCKKDWGNEEDEGHGEMVRHDVDVFGLKKGGSMPMQEGWPEGGSFQLILSG